VSKLTIDVHKCVLIALGVVFAAADASAADTPVSGEVMVQAERPAPRVVGRSQIGAPVTFIEVQHRVRYSDLDLSIPSNAKVLKTRVRDAARGACADLDSPYPLTLNGSDDCSAKAEEKAMAQVLSAIAAAEANKSAAD
jgi:UrcA family protein